MKNTEPVLRTYELGKLTCYTHTRDIKNQYRQVFEVHEVDVILNNTHSEHTSTNNVWWQECVIWIGMCWSFNVDNKNTCELPLSMTHGYFL